MNQQTQPVDERECFSTSQQDFRHCRTESWIVELSPSGALSSQDGALLRKALHGACGSKHRACNAGGHSRHTDASRTIVEKRFQVEDRMHEMSALRS
jgi:hypothetical protein